MHLIRNVISPALYLKRQCLSGKWLLGFFLSGVAARKDNVSSDIPAHRPALITPPSSLGVLILPDATENTADGRNGRVNSAI